MPFLHNRLRATLAVAALLASLGAPAIAATAAPAGDDDAQTIALQPYLGVLWSFRARVGEHEGLFLLDTAGGTTVLTPAGARLAGCEPWGRITGFRMRGDRMDLPRCDDVRLRVQGLALQAPVAGVFDLMAKTPPGSPELLGSVALDAFAGRVVTLDLAHRQLVVESPGTLAERVRHAHAVEVRLGREVEGLALTPFAGVKTDSGLLWMELDTGSDGPAVIGRHAAAALGLDASAKGGQELSASLAGDVSLRCRAWVEDLVYDGNIGSPTLARWIVTLDLDKGRMWIADVGERLDRP
jgi:hypothetical protein